MTKAATVEIEGGDEVIRAIKKFPREMQLLNGTLYDSLAEIQTEAKLNHRFDSDTGKLEESIDVELVRNLEGVVKLNRAIASYGNYIHDGFPGWRPDRFITKAALKKRPKVKKNIEDQIRRILKRLF
jgi:hypothetical protein